MASIRNEIVIEARPELVWAAIRDVGAVHRRLVPGIVTDVHLEPGARIVTFANGMIVRELILDLDDDQRRLAYAAVGGGRTTYHHASMQVFPDGAGRTRLVWITDLLPDEAAEPVGALVRQGSAAMKAALEREASTATR